MIESIFTIQALRRERTFAGNGSATTSLPSGHVIAGSVDSPSQVPVTVVTVTPQTVSQQQQQQQQPILPKHRYCGEMFGR